MSLEMRLHQLEEAVRRFGIRRPDPDDDLNCRIIRALVLAQIDMQNSRYEHLVARLIATRPNATEAQALDLLWRLAFFAHLRRGTDDHLGRGCVRVVIPKSLESQVWQRALDLRQRMKDDRRLATRLYHRQQSHTIVLTEEWSAACAAG